MKTLRKTYEVDGDTFVCKIPDPSDVWASKGMLPILPAVAPADAEAAAAEIAGDAVRMVAMLEWADMLLVRCGIDPVFVEGSPRVVPDGCVPVREINPFTRLELSGLLLRDAQFTKESAQRVVPTSATEGVS
jgi:hypothetical protein